MNLQSTVFHYQYKKYINHKKTKLEIANLRICNNDILIIRIKVII